MDTKQLISVTPDRIPLNANGIAPNLSPHSTNETPKTTTSRIGYSQRDQRSTRSTRAFLSRFNMAVLNTVCSYPTKTKNVDNKMNRSMRVA